MAQRVFWDIQEAVILLDALIAAREGRVPRREAVAAVSSELRARGVRNGIAFDAAFRNVNGVGLQMRTMEYILTGGKEGLQKSSVPKSFLAAVETIESLTKKHYRKQEMCRTQQQFRSLQHNCQQIGI